ncbi:MAG: O-antigen ligase family protein [Methylococcaceae bacterium]|nr:O-antigen ligase family protein [Methylococcaceae bacterium]
MNHSQADASVLRKNVWIDRLGRTGLYAFFLFFQLNATLSYLALLLIVLVFFTRFGSRTAGLKREPVVWLYLLIVSHILFFSAWATHQFPETGQDQGLAAINWLHCLTFIPVAWCILEDIENIRRLLLVLAAGVMIRILSHVDYGHLLELFHWPRTGFGLNPISLSLIVGMAALGLSLFAPRMTESPARRSMGWVKFGLWSIGISIFLESLILSQTRAAWLAAGIVFPLALTIRYRDWFWAHTFRSSLPVLLLGLVIFGLFIRMNCGFLLGRIQSEVQVVESVIERGGESPAPSNIEFRLILWRIGWQKWIERPMFGWGPGSTEYLLQQVADPRLSKPDGSNLFPHLHNVYLEILVRFGLWGGLLFASLAALLVAGIGQAYARREIPLDHACFLFAGWGFTAIFMFFDFQIFKYAWRNFGIVWMALSYAVRLQTVDREQPGANG